MIFYDELYLNCINIVFLYRFILGKIKKMTHEKLGKQEKGLVFGCVVFKLGFL